MIMLNIALSKKRMSSSILVQETEYLLVFSNFVKAFRTRIPSRGNKIWIILFYTISVFLEGFKTETVTSFGVISGLLYLLDFPIY